MTKHYCDVCRKELVNGEDERYSIRIETYRHGDAIELTEDDFDDQDHPDHVDAMDDLLSQQDHNEYDEDFTPGYTGAPEVGTHDFDLCGRCYTKYQVNPLGLERPQSGRYSPN
jgi:hypothetical protein